MHFKLDNLEKDLKITNSGYCFVVFKSESDANFIKKVIHDAGDKWYAYLPEGQSTLEDFIIRDDVGFPINYKDLKFESAFLEKDILWENLDSNQIVAAIKQWVFCVLLFIFFLFLMVPTNVISVLKGGNNPLWNKFVNFL